MAKKTRKPSLAKLERLLASVYDRYQELPDRAANTVAKRDFVFHMTDWLHDLNLLANLYAHPEKVTNKSAGDTVFRFIIHALPHLMEAGRLLEGHEIVNPFLELQTDQVIRPK